MQGPPLITFSPNRLPTQVEAIASSRQHRHLSEHSMIAFKPRRRALFVAVLALAAMSPASSFAQQGRRGLYTAPATGTFHPVFAQTGMVVAQEKLAARIGADILRQ